MSTAIFVRGARNVILDNVYIHGFVKGIVLENASAVLRGVKTVGCGIGLEARHSHVTTISSVFVGNAIDILAERASIHLIDTIAMNIIAYMSSVTPIHYAVNPYQVMAIAQEVLKERDPKVKRSRFRELLSKIYEYATKSIAMYELLRKILRVIAQLMGINLPELP